MGTSGKRTAIKLTPTKVERFRYDLGGAKDQRLWDLVAPGLGVQAYKSGRKSYIVRLKDGRFGTLGPVPLAVGAADLDEMRRRATASRELGHIPDLSPAQPESAEREPAGMTVSGLWEEYKETKYFETRSPDFRRGMTSTMKVHVLPAWGSLPVDKLTRKTIRESVNALIEEGREGAARGLLNRLRILLNYALEQEHIEASPAAHIKPRYTTTGRRDAWLETPDELHRAWWLDAAIQVRLMARWLLLTGCRRDEAREMRWDQIEKDDVWRLPATKNGLPLALPVMPMMEAVLAESRATFGASDYVFPATTTSFKALPRGTWDYCLRVATEAQWSAHILRHTVESHMARLGVPAEARDAVLNHVRAGTGARYQHDERLDLKRDALATWHAKIQDIVVDGQRKALYVVR